MSLTICTLMLLACGGYEGGPGALEAGKGDVWPGNKEGGAQCDYDWQCRQDLGHVCRPEVVCMRTIHWSEVIGGGSSVMEERAGVCGLPHPDGQACEDSADCAGGQCDRNRCGNPWDPANPPSRKCFANGSDCMMADAMPVGQQCTCPAGAWGTVVAEWDGVDLSEGRVCEQGGWEGWACNIRPDCKKPEFY